MLLVTVPSTQQLIALRKPFAIYDLRGNCDVLLLEKTSQLNYNKSESIFFAWFS